MTKRKMVQVRHDIIDLKLSTILDKFFNSDKAFKDVIMGFYDGNPIVDERLYIHMEECLNKLPHTDIINPDRINGSNYRELIYGLFISIGIEIHSLLSPNEEMISCKYAGCVDGGYSYDVEIQEMTL